MLSQGPFMPEKAGIRYHVISMDWFQQWKSYVDYDKVNKVERAESSGNNSSQKDTTRASTMNGDDENLSKHFNSHHVNQDSDDSPATKPSVASSTAIS